MKLTRLILYILLVGVVLLQTSTITLVRAQTATPDPSTLYIDNRSTPESLIASLYNAVNRREYLRAYSYWKPESPALKTFPEFEAGYANTLSVTYLLGSIRGAIVTGNINYDVPVLLTAQMDNNTRQTYIGCYHLHYIDPAVQTLPPFQPLAIESANIQQVPNDANTLPMLDTACPNEIGVIVPEPTATVDPLAIDASIYLDDRSDPVQLVKSLFNAVNRKEYSRAYSYWEPTAEQLRPFEEFRAGYADTQSVIINTGTVLEDAGAGQRYYRVPTLLIALATNGQTRSYIGCYEFHMSQAAIQATPPFRPLSIRSGSVTEVSNNADLTGMLRQACSANS